MRDEILTIILETASELEESAQISLDEELSENSQLFGEAGLLDSMGLVSLVIAVEQAIQERLSRSVSLADDKALSMRNSPYRSVASLADYALAQIEA